MPRGRYVLSDPHDGEPRGVERFSCAPGPGGWRYVGERADPGSGRPFAAVDLTVDEAGRQLRVEVRAGGWVLRGGVVGPRCVWVRLPEAAGQARPAEERADLAAGFLGISPAFLVALSRLGPGRRRLLCVAEPALAARPVDLRWQRTGLVRYETDAGPLDILTCHLDDLESGERRVVHLGGDVVLDAPGVELAELDSPPTRFDVGEEP